MSKVVLGLVGVGVVVAGGWYMTSIGSEKEAMMAAEKAAMEEKAMMEEKVMMEKEEMEAEAMMDKDDTMMKDKAMSDETDAMEKTDEAGAMMKDEMMKDEATVGAYLPYEASKLAMANDGDVVLFFRASWCPSCRALDGDIKANLGAIPGGVTILDVDYDTATALKQKYGVTTQHTLVQVTADGTMITKWSGGSTLASVVAKVQ
jgi:thiol-disulfide isomerase/thioredoxin